jgi:hypothetical protein
MDGSQSGSSATTERLVSLDRYRGRNANFVRVTATTKGYQGQSPWLVKAVAHCLCCRHAVGAGVIPLPEADLAVGSGGGQIESPKIAWRPTAAQNSCGGFVRTWRNRTCER